MPLLERGNQVTDEMLNIPAWMYRVANEIAAMPFRPQFFERDIAVKIARNLPSCHRTEPKWQPQEKKVRQRVTWEQKRLKRIADGLCWRCGSEIERKGRKMCNFHLEQDRMRYWTGKK